MSDWQERITRETAPAIRAEHELRYRLVAPLVETAGVWADLGCGGGLAAAAAFGGSRPEHAVLVDLAENVVAEAARELAVPDTRQLAADLSDAVALRRVAETLLQFEGERIVTCFEVVEHLSTFIPLLEWSGALAGDGAATFVISVPNDAFWSLENPYHTASWGEGAFEQLRLLLPGEHTLLRQVALTGSAVAEWDAGPEVHQITAEVRGESAVATHFIAAFGPRHHDLQRAAIAVQVDLLEQRRWERQRESNLAVAEAQLTANEEIIAKQRDELREFVTQFDEWRAYIHELEAELGRPLSGTGSSPENRQLEGNNERDRLAPANRSEHE